MGIAVDRVLDVKGLSCPMPIVETKKAMNELEGGQVIEVQATDKGSLADIQAWAKSNGHQYLGTSEEGNVLKHYLRKASAEELTKEQNYPHVVSNETLLQKLESDEKIVILDVREPAEYHFGHIPGAISIPLGSLSERAHELDKARDIYVVCRSGNRSDYAAKALAELGFSHVKNVIPGMCEWSGPLEKSI